MKGSGRAVLAWLAVGLGGGVGGASAGPPTPRICLIGGSDRPEAETRAALGGLADYLTGAGAGDCTVAVLPESGGEESVAGALAASDLAVLWVRGRPLGEAGRAAVLSFASAAKGLVVLGATGGAWSDWPGFEPEVLGARLGGAFAAGAPMRFIALFPHPILTGIPEFDTRQGMRQCELAADAQVIMEGTVGENTVPIGWVRRYGRSRLACLGPGDRALLGNADYRATVLNAVRWAGGRPIPGARTLVQRTEMSGAYPGALAINFPQGPSLCYDTVRGGIDYIWDGDFTDLHPWWTAKHGAPLRDFTARFAGRVLYRETAQSPAMHVGIRGDQSPYHFRGYRLKADGAPELFYTVGGREISEDLRAANDGVGVECTFHAAPGEAPLWLTVDRDGGAEVTVAGAVREGNYLRFDSAGAGEFSVTIRKRAAFAPSK